MTEREYGFLLGVIWTCAAWGFVLIERIRAKYEFKSRT